MIKAAVIGTGSISGVHLTYLKSRKDVQIVGLCDLNEVNLLKRHKEFGGECFADYRQMLAEVQPDAVWICTPSKVRREPLLACADRHIPIFCEKPAERDEKLARKIATELTRRKAKIQIGYVFRSLPMVQKLRDWIKDDHIHLVQSFYGCNVSLTMKLPAWFYDKTASGGALVDQATHNLDLLRYLFGEVKTLHGVAANPVHRKKAGYTIDETLALSFRFTSGTVGSHIHTWVGDGWRNEIVLSGEKRLYRLNLGKRTLTVEDPQAAADPVQQKHAGITAAAAGLILKDSGSLYEHENRLFLQQVISGKWQTNPSDYADALQTLQLTVACDRAITTGQAVQQ